MYRIAVFVLAFSLLLVGPAGADRSVPATVGDCPEQRRSDNKPAKVEFRDIARANSPISVEACGLDGAVVDAGVLSATIPAEGETVTAYSLEEDGTVELEVAHGLDGALTVDLEVHAEPEDQTRSGGKGEKDTGCKKFITLSPSRPKYNTPTKQGHESHTHRWFFSRKNFPSYLNASRTIDAAKRGSSTWEINRNNCGINDHAGSTEAYAGRTDLRVNIPRDGGCGTRDGINVAGFGPIDSTSTLARACTWKNVVLEVIEADVKFDTTGHRWWVKSSRSGCSGRWDLQGVMAHERGHTLGFRHTSEDGGTKHYTMSPRFTGACKTRERTLGRHEAQTNNQEY